MVLGTNQQTGNATADLGNAPTGAGGANVTVLLNTGASLVENHDGKLVINFEGLGSIGFLLDF